jgi:catechol 2,3-dioxygenase-like lactoylglutathione lyase family enzyme
MSEDNSKRQFTPNLSGLDHLVLTVRDIARTRAFYRRVLGMRDEEFTAADGSSRVALFFGSQKINLHQSGAEFEPKAERPQAGSADLCFLTEGDLEGWTDHLASLGINLLEGPVTRSGAAGTLRSLYIRDPDGNLIEISRVKPDDHKTQGL